jgi:hypothetical protein
MQRLYLVAHAFEGEGEMHFDVINASDETTALMRVLKLDELPAGVQTVGDLLKWAFDGGVVIGARLMVDDMGGENELPVGVRTVGDLLEWACARLIVDDMGGEI